MTTLVPLDEKKTQRSITLPDRLWDFAKRASCEDRYSKGIRRILEIEYAKRAASEKKGWRYGVEK